MRCPACGTEHPEETKRCPACGERSNRKPRRRDPLDDTDSPFSRRPDGQTPLSLRAYRCAVFSLIPFAGLVLGPAAIVLGLLAWRQRRRDPAAGAANHVAVALGLGCFTLLCNAVGLALVVKGWDAP